MQIISATYALLENTESIFLIYSNSTKLLGSLMTERKNTVNFTKLESLILERQKIDKELTALRVRNIRVLRKVISNKKIMELADQIERLISSVNYSQTEIEDLLARVEAALDLDFTV